MYKDGSQTNYRIELPGKILKTAMHEFLHRGIKAVKMDDIANLLGISKRTLYEIYSNKEKLLLECMRMHEEDYDQHMLAYSKDTGHSVIDIIIEFYKWQIMGVTDITPVFFEELRKYKNVVDYLEGKRESRNHSAKEFFMRGVNEGYFRKDVDFDIILKVGQASMEYVMLSEMYKVYPMRHILHNIIFLMLRGLCTAEGIAKLDAFIAKSPQTTQV